MITLALNGSGVIAILQMGYMLIALNVSKNVSLSDMKLLSRDSLGLAQLAVIIFIRLRELSFTSPLLPCIFGFTPCIS